MLGSGSMWEPIARALDGQVDLRAFDMPGHGRSDPWQQAPGGPDFHTAVTRIAASFIDRPTDLIGHSFGATVALRIAVAAPEAVRSLTLIEPVLFAAAPDATQAARDAEMAQLLASGRRDEAANRFMSLWGQGPVNRLSPAARAQIAAQMDLVQDSIPTLVQDAASLLRAGGLEGIDAPVMLIVGADTAPQMQAIADALAARLADVGRAVVPGAGHMLPATHPTECAGLIAVNLDRA